MVYRGKPSAACAECRKKRSRCDRAVPYCGQCIKAGRKCSGYRNTVDLMFFDESESITQKNEPRVAQGNSVADSTSLDLDQSSAILVRSASTTPPVTLTDFVLYQPMEDVGLNFFMSHYIGNDPSVSILHYLPDFYSKSGYANSGLQYTLTATGLAGYAKTASRNDVVAVATKHYVTAIRGINKALSKPETAAQDSTLMSIIMMAMFEVLASPHEFGMINCTKHLEGAVSVALLLLRTRPQNSTTDTLILTLVHTIIINCWLQSIPLPPKFLYLHQRARENGLLSTALGKFLDVVLELVQLRHALKGRGPEFLDSSEVLDHALAIDERFRIFASELKQADTFESFKLPNLSTDNLVYDGNYHVYNDRFTAHIWNNIRSSRIFLHQAVLQLHHPVLLQSSPYTTTTRSLYNPTALHYPSIEASRALITELAAEIIATIPQLAGILSHVERAHKMASHSPGASEEGQHVSLACHVQEQIRTSTNQHFTELPQITASNCASTIEYTQLFVYDAGSFKRSRGPRMKKRKATASTRTANSTAAMSDPVPLPPSMFHILFQLYGLSTIRILPGRMKTWIIECIRWLEKHSAIEDFVRVQKMARQYFGDGNYVTFED